MTNESTVSKDAIGEIMRAVVIENTAQEVLHKLAELESNRDHVLTKPIPRRDVHFGEIDDDRKDSTAPHITFRPQLGGHR